MTKTDVLALEAGREDVADLDLIVRNDDAVDEQLDQLPSLIEGGPLQPRRDPLVTEPVRMGVSGPESLRAWDGSVRRSY